MRILVIDDEATQRELLAGHLERQGHKVMTAGDGEEGLSFLHDNGSEVALVDMRMPRMDGLTFIKRSLETNPDLAIVVMTAYGTVESAVDAMKAGAFDYLLKPVDLEHVGVILAKIENNQKLITENRYLKRKLEQADDFKDIIGRSNAIKKVLSDVSRIARSDATVLIRGESGTGKELVARAIHQASPRATGPFLAVNCTSLPETLLESELFGHERGAFTGASSRHLGRFELADHGTIFLDEIGDISLPIQAKLLRVLETKTFQRLGGEKDIKVDIRVLTATNRNLEAKVKDGSFREDLFYRLNVIPVTIPPLRERRDDILQLAEFFIEKYNRKNSKAVRGVTPLAKDLLLRHSWPGNVRELENLIERAIVLSRSDVIDVADIDPFVQDHVEQTSNFENLTLDENEKRAIIEALKRTHGSLIEASELLGIHRNTLRLKIQKYRIG
ncbi:MAG TPA: two-component system response regulator [candidate division Zixibacteria bacterium]|nr:two-component system response regulator [candidate division Zixibacteria bacterium]HBZ01135.1 two-component system response regulator [candidate division Zixibacteria bacterium]